MNAVTYTAARENLAATMDRVCNNREPVIITRRIDGEHRIVYKVVGQQLWIAQLRYHY